MLAPLFMNHKDLPMHLENPVHRFAPVLLVAAMLALGGCATAPEKLARKSWKLHTINDELLYGDSVITLRFDSDSQLSGSAGCNTYKASYSADPETNAIEIDAISTTRMQCAPEIMEQEQRYLGVLGNAATYLDKCGRLKIRSQDGGILWFNKQGG